MENSEPRRTHCADKRQRLHELMIALIQKQGDFELLDDQTPRLDGLSSNNKDQDPARWLDRNRRVLESYQALVRSAMTLEALLEAEQGGGSRNLMIILSLLHLLMTMVFHNRSLFAESITTILY